ncbi:CBO0543 family protein [Halalkalibacter kiskunsagensis]|uniref:CBO0543 family protein n=1 Tax=Halalkalibacter kiskunsagensis TaxID=1548599 RepID=A0ABV6KHF7_9BACI
MTVERTVLIATWIIFPLFLLKFVPKERYREMIAVFLFFQTLTWLYSIGLTYFGLLSAPIREFPNATKINFSVEYIVFPTAAVFFQLTYPEKKGKVRRIFHYMYWVGAILLFMFLIGKSTELMTVKPGNLLRSSCNFTIELLLCRRYIEWLLKGKPFSDRKAGVNQL